MVLSRLQWTTGERETKGNAIPTTKTKVKPTKEATFKTNLMDSAFSQIPNKTKPGKASSTTESGPMEQCLEGSDQYT